MSVVYKCLVLYKCSTGKTTGSFSPHRRLAERSRMQQGARRGLYTLPEMWAQ